MHPALADAAPVSFWLDPPEPLAASARPFDLGFDS